MSNHTVIPYSATLHVKDTCLCLHAQRAARILARRFDAALKPHGLTNQQFSLMMALNRPKLPSMGPVASLLAMDRTSLTAALKPLSARGWVRIEADPADRRGKLLSLTDEGMERLVLALPVWRSLHAKIEVELAPMDADDLRQGLLSLSSPPQRPCGGLENG